MKKILALLTLAALLLTQTHLIDAAELPNPDEVRQQITNDVQQGVSTIQINPQPPVSNNNTGVTNTGDNTTVNTDTTQNNTTGVTNSNDANVNQTANVSANTGDNEAIGNIAVGGNAGTIITGDAAINVTSVVAANNNTTGVNGSGSGAGNNTGVTNTGNGVNVNSNSSGTTSTYIMNGNTVTIHQSTNASANTGGNKATKNIAIGGNAGTIITGNASVNTNYLIAANGNVALVGGVGGNGGPGSGASIYILNTGNNLNLNAFSNNHNYIVVTNENRALISQTCGVPEYQLRSVIDANTCLANTGGNNASHNIGIGSDAGVIKTADAEVNVVMRADANNNTTSVTNGNGGASNDTNLVNSGDNVNVNTGALNDTSTLVENSNSANVSQNVNARADTGNNKANYNIAIGGNAGYIETGNATVNVLMVAEVNNNTTQVNDPSASLNNGADNNTSILNTGDNANITTTTVVNNTTTVINKNDLNVDQNVNANTNTGDNNASDNISCGGTAGYIKTGDATSTVNMVVDGNTNETIIGDPDIFITPTITPTNAPNEPTPTNTPSNNECTSCSSETGGTSIINGVSHTVGEILAAATGKTLGAKKAKRLPATGAEDTLLLIGIITILFALGKRLRSVEIQSQHSN